MRRLLLVIVAGLLASACAPAAAPLDRSRLPSPATEKGVVERYYRLQGAGLPDESRSLLATDTRARYGAPGAEDRAERGLEIRSIGEATPVTDEELAVRDPALKRFTELSRVVVEFDQKAAGPTTSAGRQMRFVTVGRMGTTAPWVLVEIGTGP